MTVSTNQRIALGTAQFGLNYGITNTRGRLGNDTAQEVLAEAAACGWTLLDTAGGYGDSEERLGLLLGGQPDAPWEIITKTPAIHKRCFGADDLEPFQVAWARSRSRLGIRHGQPAALLVHHADDLLVPGGERLHDWLLALREEGTATRVGVSVYDEEQVDALFSLYGRAERPFDIVQVPASIADQRLVRGPAAQALHNMGVEIHARSLFLQGLLLAPPSFVESRFTGSGEWVRRLQNWSQQQGMSPVQACMSFFRSNPALGVAVIGVTRAEELRQIAKALASAPVLDWSGWANDDPAWIDPRRWGGA
ncbi:aldo/keto reductase [Acidovorax sp. ACV02]|uniref:aldo/keto reductase n=1 Tax=Acidovorax sp. ACV02 TaxID=2769310 RepID=UPI00177BDB03|nr:aldo/keto reductase [Acidovorax sp. ACV02]MBD9404217.1 aldo/keto reductase [Acidovorax sp. ACV02]